MDSSHVENDLVNILFTEEQIQQRLAEMAVQITEDYEGRDLLVVLGEDTARAAGLRAPPGPLAPDQLDRPGEARDVEQPDSSPAVAASEHPAGAAEGVRLGRGGHRCRGRPAQRPAGPPASYLAAPQQRISLHLLQAGELQAAPEAVPDVGHRSFDAGLVLAR